MIEKYTSDVLNLFEQKRDSGRLSANLIHITPANIRNEVRSLLITCTSSDKKMLKDFFDMPVGKELSDLTIKRCDPDKFRPLCKFLKTGRNVREKSIEVLAWLIDFDRRPFSKYWRLANGKTDLLSDLLITDNGIMNEFEATQIPQREFAYLTANRQSSSGVQKVFKRKEAFSESLVNSHSLNNENHNNEIRIEYPSGIKLFVDASDLSLIAQLVKL